MGEGNNYRSDKDWPAPEPRRERLLAQAHMAEACGMPQVAEDVRTLLRDHAVLEDQLQTASDRHNAIPADLETLRAERDQLRDIADDYAMMLRMVAHWINTAPFDIPPAATRRSWHARIVGLLQKHGGMGSPLRALAAALETKEGLRLGAESVLDDLKATREALAAAQAREAALREVLARLTGDVDDVLRGWQAYVELAQGGFGGMGYNVLQEQSWRYSSRSCWLRVERAIEQARALLAAGEESR